MWIIIITMQSSQDKPRFKTRKAVPVLSAELNVKMDSILSVKESEYKAILNHLAN